MFGFNVDETFWPGPDGYGDNPYLDEMEKWIDTYRYNSFHGSILGRIDIGNECHCGFFHEEEGEQEYKPPAKTYGPHHTSKFKRGRKNY